MKWTKVDSELFRYIPPPPQDDIRLEVEIFADRVIEGRIHYANGHKSIVGDVYGSVNSAKTAVRKEAGLRGIYVD